MHKPPKPAATKGSLNRWCLKALHQSCAMMRHRAAHGLPASKPQQYTRHQGPPPLPFACIAPHCQEWKPVAANTGYCCYRKCLVKPGE